MNKLQEMQEYTVKVFRNQTKWYQNGKLHRLDGPACEYSDGSKAWFIENVELTEQEFNARTNSKSCNGRIVEIDGKKYQLKEI